VPTASVPLIRNATSMRAMVAFALQSVDRPI
jgi:hypothetical protein